MHIKVVTPTGPHATNKTEAQLLLMSLDAIQADLRLYSAIKSSISSLVFFLNRSHDSKFHGVESEKFPNTFLILVSIQFIVNIFTEGTVHT